MVDCKLDILLITAAPPNAHLQIKAETEATHTFSQLSSQLTQSTVSPHFDASFVSA